LGKLFISSVDKSGLDGPDILNGLESSMGFDRFEHEGTRPLSLVSHWRRDSSGTTHAVSIVDNLQTVRELSNRRALNHNSGIQKISVLLPPAIESERNWMIEDFKQAAIEGDTRGSAVLPSTYNHSSAGQTSARRPH
jgi:hypothetical protein